MMEYIEGSHLIIITLCVLTVILSIFSLVRFRLGNKTKNIEKVKRTNTIRIFRIFENTETTEITYKKTDSP